MWPGLLTGQTMPHPTAAQDRLREKQQVTSIAVLIKSNWEKNPAEILPQISWKALPPHLQESHPSCSALLNNLNNNKKVFFLTLKGNRNGVLFCF